MDTSESENENDESQPDGAKKKILKLINRFKHKTKLRSSKEDSAIHHQHHAHQSEHHIDDIYDFNHPKRGVAIFIINSSFQSQPERPFADQDCKKMMELFSLLDFEIKLIENKTSVDLWTRLKSINLQIEADVDCLACVISTHGAEVPVKCTKDASPSPRHHVLFTNDGIIPTDKIMELFNDDHCPNLTGKPRMFFIQACRSVWGSIDDSETEVDKGFITELMYEHIDNEKVPVKLKKKNLQDSSKADTHGRPEDDEELKHSSFKLEEPVDYCLIPCFEDYLVMFSSSSEKIAWSDCGKGGWLTYCLYEVFKELLNTDYSISLLQILTDVCGKMSRDMETKTASRPVYDRSKSAATIYHMLTKDIFLKPVIYQAILKPGPVLETSV